MANPVRPSYRLNLNRNPTRKWAEAQSPDYGGDDWGDDDGYDDYHSHEPSNQSMHPQGWSSRGGIGQQRNFTNPAMAIGAGGQLYDAEHNHSLSSSGGYDQRYPRQPESSDSAMREYNRLTSLQMDTRGQQSSHFSGSGPYTSGDHQNDAYGLPFSTSTRGGSQQPYDADNPSSADNYDVQNQTRHRDSGTSQSAGPHPPRQSSLSQRQPIAEQRDTAKLNAGSEPLDAKPLPFIRPVDIYKRVEEEREKERRSQESSRPSFDSATGRTPSSPARKSETIPTNVSHVPVLESEQPRRMKPMLDTVEEQRAEYGINSSGSDGVFSSKNMTSSELSTAPTSTSLSREIPKVLIASRQASSVYSDRADPTSASSAENQSYPNRFGVGKSPAESPQQTYFKYTPSVKKPSGLRPDLGASRDDDDDDFPRFDHGISPKMSSQAFNKDRSVGTHQTGTGTGVSKSSLENPNHESSESEASEESVVSDDEYEADVIPSKVSGIPPRRDSNNTPNINRTDHDETLLHPVQHTMPKSSTQQAPTEALNLNDRVQPTTTDTPTKEPVDNTILPATRFVPFSQRTKTAPSENSLTETSTNMNIAPIERPQENKLKIVTTESKSTSASSSTGDLGAETLPATQYTPVTSRQQDVKTSTSQSELVPPATSRSESEDWQEWQAQRRQFKAKHGLEDSNAASPAISSPISRTESPAKGTVRDIAERLEGNTDRTTPGSVVQAESQTGPDSRVLLQNKPPPHLRNESFRPVLPGAWQSYTTTNSSQDGIDARAQLSPPLLMKDQVRSESTESVPTATAPKSWKTSHDGPVEAAFAAATAAGTAMIGAFTGYSKSRDTQHSSQTTSDNEDTEDEASQASTPHAPKFTEIRDFAPMAQHAKEPSAEDKNLTPIASETSRVNDSDTTDHTPVTPSGAVDLPAPLRTSKPDDQRQPSPQRPVSINTSNQVEHDQERLQRDIVKSLDSKTSTHDEPTGAAKPPSRFSESGQGLHRQVSIISDDGFVPSRQPVPHWTQQQTIPEQIENDVSNTAPTNTPRPPIPTATNPMEDIAQTESQPFLEKRYSWERQSVGLRKTSQSSSSGHTKDAKKDDANTPTRSDLAPALHTEHSSLQSDTTRALDTVTTERPEADRVTETVNHPAPASNASATQPLPSQLGGRKVFPHDLVDFKSILALPDASQRIRAFDENRHALAEHSGLLEQWLSSMNIPEHSEIFQAGRFRQAPVVPRPIGGQPPPRRDTSSQHGTKPNQDDGKKFVTAAGKYGGKAKIAAIGLFSRGKDKFRSASSGDKVPKTSRRTSSNADSITKMPPQTQQRIQQQPHMQPQSQMQSQVQPPFIPHHQQQHQHQNHRQQQPSPPPPLQPQTSVLPEKAPQIPSPTLNTPTGELSWSMMTSNMLNERASQPRQYSYGPDMPSSVSGVPQTTNQPLQSTTVPPSDRPSKKTDAFPDFGAAARRSENTSTSGPGAPTETTSAHGHITSSKDIGEGAHQANRQRIDSLPVPRHRRASSVSDVSDVSTGPDETNDAIVRNVSPSLENQSRGQEVPFVLQQPSSKEHEALRHRDHTESAHSTLPPYDPGVATATVAKRPPVEAGSQILPVTDLKPTEAPVGHHAEHRPFSFVGSETLNHSIAQQMGLQQRAAAAAAEQSLDDRSDRVDIEKSPQPNITEHPAYRSERHDQATSENTNPLPSARRSPQDVHQARQRQQLVIPEGDQNNDAYRIAGPYIQEYRSPRASKPTGSQDTTLRLRESTDNGVMQLPSSQFRAGIDSEKSGKAVPSDPVPSVTDRQDMAGHHDIRPPSFTATRSRSGSRNRSRMDTASPGPTQSSEYPAEEGKKRKGFFGIGNRSSSPSQPVGDIRPASALGQEQSRNRKLSMDMLKPSTFGSKPPVTDESKKKKRVSGIGGFFGKSYTKDKDMPKLERKASLPVSYRSQHSYNSSYGQPDHQQSLQQPLSAIEPSRPTGGIGGEPYMRQQFPQQTPLQHQHQHQQYAGPAKGQPFAPDSAYQETRERYDPGYPHQEPNFTTGVDRQNASGRLFGSNSPPNAVMVPGPSPYNTYQPSSDIHSPTGPAPSSAPVVPVTRANRDISYGQDRPYIPPTSPMADHVKDLHKRSRSPRLGRPPSDEFLRGRTDLNTPESTQAGLTANPASQLGMFNNKRVSPSGGIPRSEEDQEKPWIIGLPDGGEDDSSEADLSVRGTGHRAGLSNPTSAITDSSIVSPSTPQLPGQHRGSGTLISPMTATETRAQPFSQTRSAQRERDESRNNQTTRASRSDDDSQDAKHGGVMEKSQADTLPVPPSISSAPVIPDPITQSSAPAASIPANVGGEPKPTQALPYRSTRQSVIERTTGEKQAKEGQGVPQTNPPKRLTVADQILGRQSAARGTVGEHRSTTPDLGSTTPRLGTQPKSAIVQEETPRTATTSVTNPGATTVTTTTMLAGSKAGRGNVKTSTYVVDSSPPSRSSSRAISSTARDVSGSGAPAVGSHLASPLSPINTNTGANGSQIRQISEANGASRTVAAGKSFDAVELPGSRPDGYESEEEVVMSATAYPGQEWIPEFAQGVNWDD